MFRNLNATTKRKAMIDFLEKMIKIGVEVNGSGEQKFDGRPKDVIIMHYMDWTGLTNRKAKEHLQHLINMKKVVALKDTLNRNSEKTIRIFDLEGEHPYLKRLIK